MSETLNSQVGREKSGLHGSGPRRASGASFIPFFNFLFFFFPWFSWGQAPKHPDLAALDFYSSSGALAGLQKIMDVEKDIKSFIFETRTRRSGLDMATSSFPPSQWTLVIIPGFDPSLLNQVSGPTCLPLLNGTVLIEFVLLQMAAASTAQRFCNLCNAPEYKRFDCLSVVKRRRKMRDVSTAFVARVCAL